MSKHVIREVKTEEVNLSAITTLSIAHYRAIKKLEAKQEELECQLYKMMLSIPEEEMEAYVKITDPIAYVFNGTSYRSISQ